MHSMAQSEARAGMATVVRTLCPSRAGEVMYHWTCAVYSVADVRRWQGSYDCTWSEDVKTTHCGIIRRTDLCGL